MIRHSIGLATAAIVIGTLIVPAVAQSDRAKVAAGTPLPIKKSAALSRTSRTPSARKVKSVRKAKAGDIRIPPIRRVRPTMPPKPAALRKWLSKL